MKRKIFLALLSFVVFVVGFLFWTQTIVEPEMKVLGGNIMVIAYIFLMFILFSNPKKSKEEEKGG